MTEPIEPSTNWESRLPPQDVREAALYARLTALGIAWTTQAHAPVFTVEEAQQLRGSLPGGHTKNLFLKDRNGGFWLVVAREDLAVDLNALSKQLASPRFSFGAPETMVATLGVAPGAVTPFSLLNAVPGSLRVVFDAGLMAFDMLNFHPLRNDRTTAIAAHDLLAFARGLGHEPLVTNLPERAKPQTPV